MLDNSKMFKYCFIIIPIVLFTIYNLVFSIQSFPTFNQKKDLIKTTKKGDSLKKITGNLFQKLNLSEKEKEYLQKMMYIQKMWKSLDDLHEEFFFNPQIKSPYAIVGKSYLSSCLQTTPRCIRIVYNSNKQQYVYFEQNGEDKVHIYDKFRVDIGGLVCDLLLNETPEQCVSFMFFELYKKYSELIPKDVLYYLIVDTIYKIQEKKNTLCFCVEMLMSYNHIIYSSVF